MLEEYLATDRLYRQIDGAGNTVLLRPAERSRPTIAQLPQQAAAEFLTTNAQHLGINASWLTGTSLAFDAELPLPDGDLISLVFEREKAHFRNTTVSFSQFWNGIPVWRSGMTVTMKQSPARIVGVQNSTYAQISVKRPTPQKIKAAVTGKRGLVARGMSLTEAPVMEVDARPITRSNGSVDDDRVRIISDRVVVYRYDAARRFTDERPPPADPGLAQAAHHHSDQISFPVSLPDVESIEDGEFRLCREVILSAVTPPRGRIVWLALLDIETSRVLYIRPFTADVNGMVFVQDPISQGAAATPEDDQATLDPFRSSVTLLGLTAPAAGDDQALLGDNVQVNDFEPADVDPPTESVGSDFNYNARTNDFAAVNAYVHNDAFFRLVTDLGFDRDTYFGTTSFPLDVDHRGRFGSTDGIEINASCSGNGMSGIDNCDYELASTTDTANPIGIAVDNRVVLHELGGHGILYPHVNSANFGFAHSAGDSFACILSDPLSDAADRFSTFPFLAAVVDRRHDRSVGGGWAWGGGNDVGGYSSEQILATTHFRIYRSLGGDSSSLATREFAARVTSYLILAGVQTLTPATNPSDVANWVEALLEADTDDWISEGLAGGAYGKVIRWAFEKQGLYQAPGAPTPVIQEGAPPAVDVYIDDGRNGEYQYQAVHWNCQSVWNRRFADNGTLHEDPLLGQDNFCYVRVRNRGTQTATGVTVNGYHCNPGGGLTWPDDWQAMATAELTAPDIPPGGEVTVGPFTWVPSQPDHECLLMVASADGDPSNVDVFDVGDSIPEWRLVPHDNNIGQRNVHPVPAAGGVTGIMAVLDGRSFTVRNPFDRQVSIVIGTALPSVMETRGWSVDYSTPGGATFNLAAGEDRQVTLAVAPGSEFTKDDLLLTEDRAVVVSIEADGILIGGMSYELDPLRTRPLPQNDDDVGGDDDCEDPCENAAEDLLSCLDLPGQKVDSVRIRRIGVEIELEDCD